MCFGYAFRHRPLSSCLGFSTIVLYLHFNPEENCLASYVAPRHRHFDCLSILARRHPATVIVILDLSSRLRKKRASVLQSPWIINFYTLLRRLFMPNGSWERWEGGYSVATCYRSRLSFFPLCPSPLFIVFSSSFLSFLFISSFRRFISGLQGLLKQSSGNGLRFSTSNSTSGYISWVRFRHYYLLLFYSSRSWCFSYDGIHLGFHYRVTRGCWHSVVFGVSSHSLGQSSFCIVGSYFIRTRWTMGFCTSLVS